METVEVECTAYYFPLWQLHLLLPALSRVLFSSQAIFWLTFWLLSQKSHKADNTHVLNCSANLFPWALITVLCQSKCIWTTYCSQYWKIRSTFNYIDKYSLLVTLVRLSSESESIGSYSWIPWACSCCSLDSRSRFALSKSWISFSLVSRKICSSSEERERGWCKNRWVSMGQQMVV